MRVTPRASENRIGSLENGILELRVTRPALDGQATDAARRLLGSALRVAPSRVRLVAGTRSRLKRFEIEGLTADAVAAMLGRHRG